MKLQEFLKDVSPVAGKSASPVGDLISSLAGNASRPLGEEGHWCCHHFIKDQNPQGAEGVQPGGNMALRKQ